MALGRRCSRLDVALSVEPKRFQTALHDEPVKSSGTDKVGTHASHIFHLGWRGLGTKTFKVVARVVGRRRCHRHIGGNVALVRQWRQGDRWEDSTSRRILIQRGDFSFVHNTTVKTISLLRPRRTIENDRAAGPLTFRRDHDDSIT